MPTERRSILGRLRGPGALHTAFDSTASQATDPCEGNVSPAMRTTRTLKPTRDWASLGLGSATGHGAGQKKPRGEECIRPANSQPIPTRARAFQGRPSAPASFVESRCAFAHAATRTFAYGSRDAIVRRCRESSGLPSEFVAVGGCADPAGPCLHLSAGSSVQIEARLRGLRGGTAGIHRAVTRSTVVRHALDDESPVDAEGRPPGLPRLPNVFRAGNRRGVSSVETRAPVDQLDAVGRPRTSRWRALAPEKNWR